MPPRPIDEIDFEALGDKILELLLAVWTFLCDLCLAIWDTLCQAFWAVWTYPPFEASRNEFIATLIALMDYVVAHPVTSTAIFILAFIVVPRVLNAVWTCFLHSMGFRRRGVLRGSYAANYQSTSYGANVPRGSTYARFQSQGAKGGGRYRPVGTGSSNWR